MYRMQTRLVASNIRITVHYDTVNFKPIINELTTYITSINTTSNTVYRLRF